MNQETTIDSNKLGTQSSQNPSLQSSFISFIDEQLDEHLQQKSQQYQIDFRNDTPFMMKDDKEGYIMQNINKTIQPLETIDSVEEIALKKSLRQQDFDMSRDSAILNSQISFLDLNKNESMHSRQNSNIPSIKTTRYSDTFLNQSQQLDESLIQDLFPALKQSRFSSQRNSLIFMNILQEKSKQSNLFEQRLKLIHLKERDPIGSEMPINIEKLSIYQSHYQNFDQANVQRSMSTMKQLNKFQNFNSLMESSVINYEVRQDSEFKTPNKRKLGQKLTHKQVLNQSSPDQKAILKQLKRQNMNLTFGMKSRIALAQQTSNKISKNLSPNNVSIDYQQDQVVQDKTSLQDSSLNQIGSNCPTSKNIKAKEDNIFPKETEEISKSFGIPQIHPQH